MCVYWLHSDLFCSVLFCSARVAGIWRAAIDNVNVMATDVVASSASQGLTGKSEAVPASQTNISLAAAAYQNGDVRLFNYPCTSQFVSGAALFCALRH